MKLRLIVALLIFGIAIAASVVGYHVSRNDTNEESTFGDFDRPDRVELTVWITHVDPTLQNLSMTIMSIQPFGKFSKDGDFADDATMSLNSIGDWRFDIKRGESAVDDKVQTGITGWVTDYPFDRYDANISVNLIGSDGKEIPTAITVLNSDAFYKIDMSEDANSPYDGTFINLSIRRTTSTLVFGIFIMALMLALAAASVIAAYYVLHWRRGLDLGAASLMAAMLFALIPLRNAVPGDPPIGSIIDFGSFFIAEATIAISLISCVVLGYRQQMKANKLEAMSPD